MDRCLYACLEVLLRLVHSLARPDNVRREGARLELPMPRPVPPTVSFGPIRTPTRSPHTAAATASCGVVSRARRWFSNLDVAHRLATSSRVDGIAALLLERKHAWLFVQYLQIRTFSGSTGLQARLL